MSSRGLLPLFLRVTAMLLLAVTFLARAWSGYDRVIVVALPSARLPVIRRMAAGGELPVMRAMVETGVGGTIIPPDHSDEESFWSVLLPGLREISDLEDSGAEGSAGATLWGRVAPPGAISVNVPGTKESRVGQEGLRVLPGPDPVHGFVGSNVGEVIEAADVGVDELPAPYKKAEPAVRDVVEALYPGEWSGWIETKDGDGSLAGSFKVCRTDLESLYFTPVYRLGVTVPGQGDEVPLLYRAEEAEVALVDPEVRKVAYDHARDLSARRAEAAQRLARGNWRLLVHYETLLGDAEAVAAGRRDSDSADAVDPVIEQAYRDVDARLGRLIGAASGAVSVTLVGGPPGHAASGDDSAFFLISTFRGSPVPMRSTAQEISEALAYMSGVLPGSGRRGPLLGVVRARFSTRGEPQRRPVAEPAILPPDVLPLEPEILRSIGALSDSASGA